jgi:hypothetical protein
VNPPYLSGPEAFSIERQAEDGSNAQSSDEGPCPESDDWS